LDRRHPRVLAATPRAPRPCSGARALAYSQSQRARAAVRRLRSAALRPHAQRPPQGKRPPLRLPVGLPGRPASTPRSAPAAAGPTPPRQLCRSQAAPKSRCPASNTRSLACGDPRAPGQPDARCPGRAALRPATRCLQRHRAPRPRRVAPRVPCRAWCPRNHTHERCSPAPWRCQSRPAGQCQR
jgi:hypothetical protein